MMTRKKALKSYSTPNSAVKKFALIIVVVGLIYSTYRFFSSQHYQNFNSLTDDALTDFSVPNTIFPFIREGNLLLYQNGKESILATSTHKSSPDRCRNLMYPLISPNSKYIAYLEQYDYPPEFMGLCTYGELILIDLHTRQKINTHYRVTNYHWNSYNQLQLIIHAYAPSPEGNETTESETEIKFLIYDPSTQTEVAAHVSDGSLASMIRGFPLYGTDKKIVYSDRKLYLVTPESQTLLFEKGQVLSFVGFSPDGKYALFQTNKQVDVNDYHGQIWYAVDTQNPKLPKIETPVLQGGAGASPYYIGPHIYWFFDSGFIVNCSELLSFVDGTKPLELTREGGGGCNHANGFVATSPNGSAALLKFQDRFELRTKSGKISKVEEVVEISKGRFSPAHLYWINNQQAVIFSTLAPSDNYAKPSTIYLFDMNTNKITPLVPNGYLVETND